MLMIDVDSWELDRDTGVYCQEKAESEYCIKDPNAFFDCPIVCANHLQPTNPSWGGFESQTDSPFFELRQATVEGKVFDFGDLEGSIAMVVLVPLYPGLAPYYQKLLQHLQTMYPYLVRILILPMPGQDGIELHPDNHDQEQQPLVVLLEPVDETKVSSHPVVSYLSSKIQKGVFDPTLVNAFIVSPNGNHIEMHMSPTMARLQKRIKSNIQDEL